MLRKLSMSAAARPPARIMVELVSDTM